MQQQKYPQQAYPQQTYPQQACPQQNVPQLGKSSHSSENSGFNSGNLREGPKSLKHMPLPRFDPSSYSNLTNTITSKISQQEASSQHHQNLLSPGHKLGLPNGQTLPFVHPYQSPVIQNGLPHCRSPNQFPSGPQKPTENGPLHPNRGPFPQNSHPLTTQPSTFQFPNPHQGLISTVDHFSHYNFVFVTAKDQPLTANMNQNSQRTKGSNSKADQLLITFARMIFEKHDSNGTGFLDIREIMPAVIEVFEMRELNAPNRPDILRIMKTFDEDGNGLIDLREFTQILITMNSM